MKRRNCDKCNEEIRIGGLFFNISENNKGVVKKIADLCLNCIKDLHLRNGNENKNL